MNRPSPSPLLLVRNHEETMQHCRTTRNNYTTYTCTKIGIEETDKNKPTTYNNTPIDYTTGQTHTISPTSKVLINPNRAGSRVTALASCFSNNNGKQQSPVSSSSKPSISHYYNHKSTSPRSQHSRKSPVLGNKYNFTMKKKLRPQLLKKDLSLASIPRITDDKDTDQQDSIAPDSSRHQRGASPEKRVCFGEKIQTQEFISIEKPLTEDERSDYYYSAQDIEGFDKDRQLTLLLFRKRREKGIAWNEDDCSLRGLEECVFTSKTKSRRQVRKEHVQNVLGEQARLREAGLAVFNAESLREMSLQTSKKDKHRAVALAMKDAQQAGHSISGRQLLMKKLKSLSKRSMWKGVEKTGSRKNVNADR